MDTPKKRVMLVDDHPVFRSGLAHLIESEDEFTVVGQTDNAKDAQELFKSLKPDVCVVDVSLKETSGLELVKLLKDIDQEAKVLVLSMHSEDFYAERALRSGAKGYVMKEQASEEIISALRTVTAGNVYLSQRMMNKFYNTTFGGRKDTAINPVSSLTDRELEVLQLLSEGKGTKEIAFSLSLSSKTVETHRAHIMHKLGLKNSNELLQYAVHWKLSQH